MAQVTASPSQLKDPQEPPQEPSSNLQIGSFGDVVQKSDFGCDVVFSSVFVVPSESLVVVVVVVVQVVPTHLVLDVVPELFEIVPDPLAPEADEDELEVDDLSDWTTLRGTHLLTASPLTTPETRPCPGPQFASAGTDAGV